MTFACPGRSISRRRSIAAKSSTTTTWNSWRRVLADATSAQGLLAKHPEFQTLVGKLIAPLQRDHHQGSRKRTEEGLKPWAKKDAEKVESKDGEARPQGIRRAAQETAHRARQGPGVDQAQGPQGVRRVRRSRWRRQGRHHQGHHRSRESARVSRGGAAGADRAREEPDVRAALPAIPARGGRGRDLRSQLVQPRGRRARAGLLPKRQT